MNTNTTSTTPALLYFEQIAPYMWAVRYSCRDSTLFYEIKDVIMFFHKDDRRWDPTLYNGKGAWVLHETVCYEIERYFPGMKATLDRGAQQ